MKAQLTSGTGTVTVTEQGGRVAELRPETGGPNVLWRGTTVLPLTGGDRLWLAPERDLFYPPRDEITRDDWDCPAELDPGDWKLAEGADGSVELQQTALGVRMTRSVHALHEPPVPCALPWAGYRVDDAIETDRPWSAWHLVMVAAPADLFVRGAGDPLVMYAPAPSTEDGWIAADGVAPEWKVGLHAPPDGRVVIAAVGRQDPGPLVVKVTRLDPAGTYVDVPPLGGGGPGTAIQLYSSAGKGFCEIEHHAPLETRATSTTVVGAWGDRHARLALLDAIAEDGATS